MAGLFTGVATAPSPATADGPTGPGQPITVEPLPDELWLPNTAEAYRLRYTSTGLAGEKTAVTGVIFVPRGTPPALGWPVVSWAHGTVGVADPCAPSTNGRSQRDIDYLSAWLGAGYAVVATDYHALGTPGLHPYLHGVSEAHATIDMVRAGQWVVPELSRTWLAVGQSQGAQAAMFTASLVEGYAPELDFRGAIGTGLPSQLRTTAEAAQVFNPAAPANPLVLLILAGLQASHSSTFQPADYLTDPLGQRLLARAVSTHCFTDLEPLFDGQRVADVYAIDAAEQETLLQMLDEDAEIPIVTYDGPVFIAQGTEDRVVFPPASKTTAQLLAAAGNEVEFKFYVGADHDTTLRAALPDLLAWAADQVA